jgi:hypothetical protein
MGIELLGKSCFESCTRIETVVFEDGSQLRRISPLAFSGCEYLISVTIPASVEIIENSAFKYCDGLEECLIAEDAILVRIENEAFADCRSLGSFYVPHSVDGIGENCFKRCVCLYRLTFGSQESLRKIIGDATLDEALEHVGFDDVSSLFEIEVDDGRVDLEFPGWTSIGDTDSTVILVRSNS